MPLVLLFPTTSGSDDNFLVRRDEFFYARDWLKSAHLFGPEKTRHYVPST